MTETEGQNHNFEDAVARAAQGNYKTAAEYLVDHPERYQELYDKLIEAYGSHKTPDTIAKLMQDEIERIKKEREL